VPGHRLELGFGLGFNPIFGKVREQAPMGRGVEDTIPEAASTSPNEHRFDSFQAN
jgi:hypothetical protein